MSLDLNFPAEDPPPKAALARILSAKETGCYYFRSHNELPPPRWRLMHTTVQATGKPATGTEDRRSGTGGGGERELAPGFCSQGKEGETLRSRSYDVSYKKVYYYPMQ